MIERFIHVNTSTGVKNTILNTLEEGIKNIGVSSADDLKLLEENKIPILKSDSVIEDKEYNYKKISDDTSIESFMAPRMNTDDNS
mgnify:CR=1 FL=1